MRRSAGLQLVSQELTRLQCQARPRPLCPPRNCRLASSTSSYTSRNISCISPSFAGAHHSHHRDIARSNFKRHVSSRTHTSASFTPSFPNDHDHTHSLHSNIHYILSQTKIPVGRMNNINRQKARSFLFITSKWANEQGATLSEALLERLHQEQETNHNEAIVDTDMYNACMHAWNISGADGKIIVQNVESILTRMEQRCADDTLHNSHRARPDRTSYNCLLHSYSKCDEDSSWKVQAVLEKMNAMAQESKDREYASKVQPDEITYNTVMNYYATRTKSKFAAQHAEDILLQMSELSQHTNSNVRITSTSFNIVLKAWSNSGCGWEGAERAKSLLHKMIQWHNHGHANVAPTAVSFSTVMDAYTKVERVHASTAVENAMELLDWMEASSISDPEHVHSCYNAMAKVCIRMGVENVGERVMELMRRMKNMDAVPDERMYTRCIEAYAREGSEGAFAVAFGVLDEMREHLQCNPSSVAFNSLLDALLKKQTDQSMELAEKLMKKMESLGGDSRPDIASYNMMISALSRSSCKGSEQKAVDYLRSMLRSFNNDHYSKAKPTSFVFNSVIAMLDRSSEEWADDVMYKTLMSMENQQRQGNASVIPDTITYNTVIGKLSKRPTKENAKKVMKLLTQMESKEEDGNFDASPDIITYTNILKIQSKLDPNRASDIASRYVTRSLARSPLPPMDRVGLRALLMALSRSGKFENAFDAISLWERLEGCGKTTKLLDSDTCNLVLLAFSKVKTEQSADIVLSFLTERLKRLSNGDKSIVLPTVVGMNAALTVLSNSGRINDALSIVEIMKALYMNGHSKLQPDPGCYTSILTSVASVQSSSKNNALYAEKVLKKAKEELEVVPITLVNAAINACAWTSGDQNDKKRAIQIAFEIFDQTKERSSYDAVTFGLMIKACMKLSSDDDTRFKLVQRLFQVCAKNGLVGNMVMREIGHFKPMLLPDGKVPQAWKIHANDK
ncbi:hypothetical protein HJC23_009417 [Cyclotella cryptica]|uniref:Pentacotripeptide-repeat region of PRORP domain-containing protein n=1 Tax=Cyclotella cryptica TaxID=29204 RepID=A0ABD3PYQ4_9STRA